MRLCVSDTWHAIARSITLRKLPPSLTRVCDVLCFLPSYGQQSQYGTVSTEQYNRGDHLGELPTYHRPDSRDRLIFHHRLSVKHHGRQGLWFYILYRYKFQWPSIAAECGQRIGAAPLSRHVATPPRARRTTLRERKKWVFFITKFITTTRLHPFGFTHTILTVTTYSPSAAAMVELCTCI